MQLLRGVAPGISGIGLQISNWQMFYAKITHTSLLGMRLIYSPYIKYFNVTLLICPVARKQSLSCLIQPRMVISTSSGLTPKLAAKAFLASAMVIGPPVVPPGVREWVGVGIGLNFTPRESRPNDPMVW